MDIRAYLKEEGIEGRINGTEFEQLKASLPPDQKAELDENSSAINCDPRLIKEHYAILAKTRIFAALQGLLYEEILAHTPLIAEYIKPYQRILDAGCGDALKLCYYAHACPDSTFLGIDYCSEALTHATNRIKKRQLKNVEITALDIADIKTLQQEFDCITATNVLHERYCTGFDCGYETWVQDLATGIQALSEVLSPDGKLLFTLHFNDDYNKECVTDYKINRALKKAGLIVETQEDITFNHFDHQKINGLWICRKQ